ncbi:hypothetical protein SERLA73DRAFT_118788 [Serpula lacrymans var. lacrymans S7.3]|uniref:Uncharacterized protein n=2 Tax=Serpula lacrymans var. lacrymans TaxID=341189 RepID=F8PF36_SERL3|nr:uncharacterized protein SERLADRAFT_364701 [Serpula lacrymans var. lacrymans S7.9]EGO05228.1 hypothetical protein SERLA73DRAFT_118788 [Serpula lacrymans var. lacrymans S7.3]EGO30969.1 hypothetical protein SERLADRAFT_364701 [Serpula lacrymans var. lacrymans S7.9]
MRMDNFHEKETYRGEESAQVHAAIQIQRAWRRRHTQTAHSFQNTDARWKDTAIHTQLKLNRIAAYKGKNDPLTRWKRSKFFAGQIQGSDSVSTSSPGESPITRDNSKKILETQHWLELVDG